MLTVFNAFVTEYRTTEANRQKFQEKRDAEIKDALEARDKRLNRWLAIITVLLLAFGAWLTFRDSLRKTSSVTPPAVVSSSQKQESGIQPMIREVAMSTTDSKTPPPQWPNPNPPAGPPPPGQPPAPPGPTPATDPDEVTDKQLREYIKREKGQP